MSPDRATVQAEVLDLVNELAGDWEFDGEVTPDTFFLNDLGLESLDLVVLGTSIQYKYGPLPFAEYLAAARAAPGRGARRSGVGLRRLHHHVARGVACAAGRSRSRAERSRSHAVTVDVLFLGLDGATFTVLDPLMAAGVMPNLRGSASRACAARCRR